MLDRTLDDRTGLFGMLEALAGSAVSSVLLNAAAWGVVVLANSGKWMHDLASDILRELVKAAH